MTGYVLAGLTERPVELAGEAETLRSRLAQIATDVGHLAAVIRQFDLEYDLASIEPRRPHVQDAAGRGEISRLSAHRRVSDLGTANAPYGEGSRPAEPLNNFV